MTGQLHITNGDAVGDMLGRMYGDRDEILCWRDVLHDGPLTLAPLETHRRRRARFLADTLLELGDTALGAEPYARILGDLVARDERLMHLSEFTAVTLWFEHDLYDQLQIAEILHRLAVTDQPIRNLSLICIDHHPDVPHFHGLGNLNPTQLAALHPQRQILGAEHLAAGRRVWEALCADDPRNLQKALGPTTDRLPFMSAAVQRFCAEYPHRQDGLTQTQRLLLQAIGAPLTDLPLLRHHLRQQERSGRLPAGTSAEARYREVLTGPLRLGRIFLSLQTLETAPFLGDLWVQKELALLATAATPYLSAQPDPKTPKDRSTTAYALTPAGQAALDGRLHWADVNQTDCWRGGVHLSAAQMWYWDPQTGFVRSP
ncbi:MAG: DUF1835 domain-containing protein [Desulfosarcinaceae bacterium]|nr:DUF1835 domain-containing protein [Desulfosarcinaceae bacterium]